MFSGQESRPGHRQTWLALRVGMSRGFSIVAKNSHHGGQTTGQGDNGSAFYWAHFGLLVRWRFSPRRDGLVGATFLPFGSWAGWAATMSSTVISASRAILSFSTLLGNSPGIALWQGAHKQNTQGLSFDRAQSQAHTQFFSVLPTLYSFPCLMALLATLVNCNPHKKQPLGASNHDSANAVVQSNWNIGSAAGTWCAHGDAPCKPF